jgi:hypothetical protein
LEENHEIWLPWKKHLYGSQRHWINRPTVNTGHETWSQWWPVYTGFTVHIIVYVNLKLPYVIAAMTDTTWNVGDKHGKKLNLVVTIFWHIFTTSRGINNTNSIVRRIHYFLTWLLSYVSCANLDLNQNIFISHLN